MSLEQELKGFTGSEAYHKWSILFPFKLTDGAKYLAEKAGAYWLMDVVASYQGEKKFKAEEFQVWELKKEDGDACKVTATDGNGNILVTQDLDYTDFPLDSVELYFINGIILLPSEY